MEPHSLVEERGKVVILVGAWPAASKTNASWPAHQLGRAGEVIHRREEKRGTRMVTFCLLPKGTCPRPQPAQPVGGPLGPFAGRAAGQVSRKRYSLPHTTPPEKGSPEGRTSSLWGSFPISSQEMGPRPGRPRFPPVPTAWVMEQPPPTAKETPACQKIRNLI